MLLTVNASVTDVTARIALPGVTRATELFTVNASVNDVTARITLPGVTRATELSTTADFELAQPGVLDIPFTRHQVRIFEVE